MYNSDTMGCIASGVRRCPSGCPSLLLLFCCCRRAFVAVRAVVRAVAVRRCSSSVAVVLLTTTGCMPFSRIVDRIPLAVFPFVFFVCRAVCQCRFFAFRGYSLPRSRLSLYSGAIPGRSFVLGLILGLFGLLSLPGCGRPSGI